MKEIIIDNGTELGVGKGFTGHEVLTKDELSLIMDLEDEKVRATNFDIIFPRPSTCSHYYSYMEIRRYQNALYCAWYSTPKKIRFKLLSEMQNYHSANLNSDSEEDESYEEEESEEESESKESESQGN